MALLEDPEPPAGGYKVRQEWFTRKLKMYVVRDSNGEFITALSTKNLALTWVETQKYKRRE